MRCAKKMRQQLKTFEIQQKFCETRLVLKDYNFTIVSSNMSNAMCLPVVGPGLNSFSEILSELKLTLHVCDKTKTSIFSITGKSCQISQNT